MTTANCYMIHAPGYYKLPLVYGNAIKNGMVNTVAFNPEGTASDTYTDRFVNHVGVGITGPWITKSGSGLDAGMDITVNGAQLIWQDVDALTTDYVIDGDYLKFQVPAASIAEGNAVIAVMSGSTIVWSWHIWVTAETYTNLPTVNTGQHNYRLTPVNLGWVESESIVRTGYDGRSCVVKVIQTGTGGLERSFEVTQVENIIVTTTKKSNSPYYQWGRKDPFVPSEGSSNKNKTVYVGSGVPAKGYVYEAATNTTTIGTNIQFPWKFYQYNSNYGPVSTSYYNMWDAQNTSTDNVKTATKKTVYDPCPPGFCVPTGYLFYYASRRSSSFVQWDNTKKGRTWTDMGHDFWFPALGMRARTTGNLTQVTGYGDYWSASPSSTSQGYAWEFYSTGSYCNSIMRALGILVRPVAEE